MKIIKGSPDEPKEVVFKINPPVNRGFIWLIVSLALTLVMGGIFFIVPKENKSSLVASISDASDQVLSQIFSNGAVDEKLLTVIDLNPESGNLVDKGIDRADPSLSVEEEKVVTKVAEKININSAGSVELRNIEGVGETIASRIIAYRNSVSPFYKIEDIKNVEGIGEAKFEKMKEQITVGDVIMPPPPPVAMHAVTPIPPQDPPPPPPPENPPPLPAPSPESNTNLPEQDPQDPPPSPPSENPPFENPSPPSAPQPPPPPEQSPVSQNHVLITEIMAGSESSSGYEFIEFYNPTAEPIDLTGWSVKKRSSTGSESLLIVSGRLEGKIIMPQSFLLAANEGGYDGAVRPDVFWPKSNTLAYANNAILLYNSDDQLVAELPWEEIPKDQSLQRNFCGSDQKFCDTGNAASDFSLRNTPTPAGS